MMRCCSSKERVQDRSSMTKSPKSEKELTHICPAKLSKRELEDLYFALLQSNLDLKKSLNQQAEKVRLLSSKVQRMQTTQKTYLNKDPKECCGPTKAVVQEQNKTIADLTKANDQLQEQIKQLNMKLCSTKQFLKRSSNQQSVYFMHSKATARPNSSFTGRPVNSSTSALNSLKNDDVTNIKMKSVSSQCLELVTFPVTKSTTTSVDQPEEVPPAMCDENRCKTLMEELKNKIVSLQEELDKTHEEYSDRISKLEQEVSGLREENAAALAEAAAKKHNLDMKMKEAREIKKKLRNVECQCCVLESQLTLEKGRVAELETQVKAANMTSEAARNVEEQINNNKSQLNPLADESREVPDDIEPLVINSTDKDNVQKRDTNNPLVEENALKNVVGDSDTKPSAPKASISSRNRDNDPGGTKLIEPSGLRESCNSNKAPAERTDDYYPDNKAKDPQYTKFKDSGDLQNSEVNKSNKPSPDSAVLDTGVNDRIDPKANKTTDVSKYDISKNSDLNFSVVAKSSVTGKVIDPSYVEAIKMTDDKCAKCDARNDPKYLEVYKGKDDPKDKENKKSFYTPDESYTTANKRNENPSLSEVSKDPNSTKVIPDRPCAICGASNQRKAKDLEPTDQDSIETLKQDDIRLKEGADDSGYTDGNKSSVYDDLQNAVSKGLAKINQELMKKIVDLQSQLDNFRIAMAGSEPGGGADKTSSKDSTPGPNKQVSLKLGPPDEKSRDEEEDNGNRPSPGTLNDDTNRKESQNDMDPRRKNRSDDDSRYQIPGPMPIDSPPKRPSYAKLSNQDSLPNTPSSSYRKFKPVRDSVFVKKEQLRKLDELEMMRDKNEAQNPRARRAGAKSTGAKKKDFRNGTSKNEGQKINFQPSPDSLDSPSRHSRCFQESPPASQRASVMQNAKDSAPSIVRSAKDPRRSQTPQSIKESINLPLKLSSKDDQEPTTMKDGSNLPEDTPTKNEVEAQTDLTLDPSDATVIAANVPDTLDGLMSCICRGEPAVCLCRSSISQPQDNVNVDDRTKSKAPKSPKQQIDTPVKPENIGSQNTCLKIDSELTVHSQNATGLKNFGANVPDLVTQPKTSERQPSLTQLVETEQGSQKPDAMSLGFQPALDDSKFLNTCPEKDILMSIIDKVTDPSKDTSTMKDAQCEAGTYVNGSPDENPASTNVDIPQKDDEINVSNPQRLLVDQSFAETLPQATSSPYQATKLNAEATQMPSDQNEVKILETECDVATHVCSCPKERGGGSISAKPRTSRVGFRKCSCVKRRKENTATCGTQVDVQPVRTQSQFFRRGSDESAPKTYNLPCYPQPVRCSRGTSPDNTDQEISSLSDLPTEHSDKASSPRCKHCYSPPSLGEDTRLNYTPMSPGEDTRVKYTPSPESAGALSTAVYSDVQSSATEPYELSEGELRNEPRGADIKPLSTTERPTAEECSSSKVEAALAAITEELARCRQLLMRSRSQENPVNKTEANFQVASVEPEPLTDMMLEETPQVEKEVPAMSEVNKSSLPPILKEPITEEPTSERTKPEVEDSGGGKETKDQNDKDVALMTPTSAIALKRAEGRPRIGDAYSPRVMFTLHIGTVVLSDEALINSRELVLVLTWQFYEQNVAMCRLRPGRVVPFDFSTEYDLKLTDEFLEYLKSEELPIKICEENKLDVPFASCWLPLRDALLHTNRRADMSLALMAGPRMTQMERTADDLDQRDELGVLDVWCMLRADPRLLPTINKAIAHSTRLSSQRAPSLVSGSARSSRLQSIMTQINEDDQDELRISADLEPPHLASEPSSRSGHTSGSVSVSDAPAPPNVTPATNYGYRDSANFPVYIPPDDEHIARNSVDIKHPASSMLVIKPQLSFDNKWNAMESEQRTSGIIANEVPVNIRSPLELKQAIEERQRRSSVGQGSLASGLGKQKKLVDQNVLPPPPRALSVENYLNNTQYANLSMIKQTDTESATTQAEIGYDNPELSKKYDFVSKMMARKAVPMETGRRVTIKRDDSISVVNSQEYPKPVDYQRRQRSQSIDITILWLALNEECSAMGDPAVQRLYVAYSFLGRGGAELETPMSLPKPKQYQDKCHFNFKKSFQLTDSDLPTLGRMAKCRSPAKGSPNPRESVVFTVVSEPVEDPLGMNNCEDIGNAHLYLGDLLAYSAGSDTYTEVIPVRATIADDIIGVLAVRVDGLDVVRKCVMLSDASTLTSR